jgi:hypothetical protein
VCLDADGKPQFRDLLFRRGEPRFVAFDLLWCEGEDLRYLPLIDRKRRLHSVVRNGGDRLLYCDHVEHDGGGCSGRLVTSTSKESSPSESLTLIWRVTRLGLRFETGITLSGRGGKNCSSASAGAILISKFGTDALWHATAARCDPEDCQLTTGKVDPEFRPVPQVRSTPHRHWRHD